MYQLKSVHICCAKTLLMASFYKVETTALTCMLLQLLMHDVWVSDLLWYWESIMEASFCSNYDDGLIVVRFCAIKPRRMDVISYSPTCHYCD